MTFTSATHPLPSLTGRCALGHRCGKSLPEFEIACRNSLCMFGESSRIPSKWQPAEFNCKTGSGLRRSQEAVRLLSSEADTTVTFTHPWKQDAIFLVQQCSKKRGLYMRLDRLYNKRALYWGPGNWRCELPEATERRSLDFKSSNAPSSFVSKSQNRESQSGKVKRDVGRQVDHSDVSGTISAKDSVVLQDADIMRKVKVIGAGAGTSPILNFCQKSSLLPAAQFWYSADAASDFVRLSDYTGGSNAVGNGAETEGSKESLVVRGGEETLFLVLGVGRETALGFVPGQLRVARSKGSLVVGIFIQPFMFEGPKRLEQANELIDVLLKCTDLLVVVEQDVLLRRDTVTVSEASNIASNAVLLSMKGILDSVLGYEADKDGALNGHAVDGSTATPESHRKVLQNSGKAWLGSGRGNTPKEAVEMAVVEAPTFDSLVPDANQLVICTMASDLDLSSEEVHKLECVLYAALGPAIQVMVSVVKNPMLENGLKLATVIITRPNSEQSTGRILTDKNSTSYGTPKTTGSATGNGRQTVTESGLTSSNNVQAKSSSTVSRAPQGRVSDNGTPLVTQEKPTDGNQSTDWNFSQNMSKWLKSSKLKGKKSSIFPHRIPSGESVKTVDTKQAPQQAMPTSGAGQKSRLAWEAGPNSDVAKAWAQARAEARRPLQAKSALDVSLPVGIRHSEEQDTVSPNDNFSLSAGLEVAEDKWIGTRAVPVDPDALPRNRMMGMGLDAVRDMYNAASALVMRKEMTDERREASLSQRAASMLESERSQKKLTPLVEMDFKNGIYKGRCQGGLPEGKGRLSFPDGSFYDGQWKQGKRAGSGAFYYTNGDMFQGSWKDDVMHGKGWIYYHNGDRLYTNFWKGKADGEGRFYSAQGDVFFGQFRDNWRHGEFLYIEASGVRWIEVWDSGVLSKRSPADT